MVVPNGFEIGSRDPCQVRSRTRMERGPHLRSDG